MGGSRTGPVRVLLAVESAAAGSGGIARVARLVARVLAEEQRQGVLRADVVSLSDDAPPADLGLPVETVRGSRARFVYRVRKAALTHSHFIFDFAGMARAHWRTGPLRRPYMIFIHGIEVWEGAREDRVRLSRGADLLLANSRYTLERAERVHGGYAHGRVCWLATETDEPPAGPRDPGGRANPGGPPDPGGRANPGGPPYPDRPPRVLILARLDDDAYKGHGELIGCWPEVAAAVPGARLVIAGGGPALEKIRGLAASSPSAGSIDVTGFVPEEEIESLWSEATVFAMPSRGEGFGLVYIEAMRHGVPVIASVHDAAPEINVDGETGYNVDPDRPGDLADRVIRLLRDRELADRLGRGGRSRWAEHFRFSAYRERFLPILRDFLGVEPAAAPEGPPPRDGRPTGA